MGSLVVPEIISRKEYTRDEGDAKDRGKRRVDSIIYITSHGYRPGRTIGGKYRSSLSGRMVEILGAKQISWSQLPHLCSHDLLPISGL